MAQITMAFEDALAEVKKASDELGVFENQPKILKNKNPNNTPLPHLPGVVVYSLLTAGPLVSLLMVVTGNVSLTAPLIGLAGVCFTFLTMYVTDQLTFNRKVIRAVRKLLNPSKFEVNEKTARSEKGLRKNLKWERKAAEERILTGVQPALNTVNEFLYPHKEFVYKGRKGFVLCEKEQNQWEEAKRLMETGVTV